VTLIEDDVDANRYTKKATKKASQIDRTRNELWVKKKFS
jgi:hypothetical protein